MVLNDLNKKKKKEKEIEKFPFRNIVSTDKNKNSKEKKKSKKLKFKKVKNKNNILLKKKLLRIKKRKIYKFKRVYQLRNIYLFFAKYSVSEREAFSKFFYKKAYSILNTFLDIKFKSQLLLQPKKGTKYNFLQFFTTNYKLSNLHFFKSRDTQLFIKKFANFLMIEGKKRTAMKIILKFLEILKRDFHILDVVYLLQRRLFKNLVPVIRPKTVGFINKKVIGIPVPIYKRISTSFKLFIKGARSHRIPIVYGLIVEFFNFYKNNTLLQQTNKKTVSDIMEHSLYKYVQVDRNMITPEKFYDRDMRTKQKFTLKHLFKIDWKNFDKIVLNIYELDLQIKLKRQNVLNFLLKYFVLDKFVQKPSIMDPYPVRGIHSYSHLLSNPPINLLKGGKLGKPVEIRKYFFTLPKVSYSVNNKKAYFDLILSSNLSRSQLDESKIYSKKSRLNNLFRLNKFEIFKPDIFVLKSKEKRFLKNLRVVIENFILLKLFMDLCKQAFGTWPKSFDKLKKKLKRKENRKFFSIKKYIIQKKKPKFVMQTYALTPKQEKRWYFHYKRELQKRTKVKLFEKNFKYLFKNFDTSKIFLNFTRSIFKDVPSNRAMFKEHRVWVADGFTNPLIVEKYPLEFADINSSSADTDNVEALDEPGLNDDFKVFDDDEDDFLYYYNIGGNGEYDDDNNDIKDTNTDNNKSKENISKDNTNIKYSNIKKDNNKSKENANTKNSNTKNDKNK